MTNAALSALLARGVLALPYDVPVSVQHKLIDYVMLMAKWNAAFNLTAIRNPQDMIIKHVLDSLVIHPWISGDRILDVGTGGGLPGIPLALMSPGRQFTLLDSNGKKTRFLTQAKAALGLDNVSVANVRIEQHDAGAGYPQIVSRAFSSLSLFASLARPKLAPGGELLAMKGQLPDNEMSDPEVAALQTDVIPLSVPMLSDARHLVVIRFPLSNPQQGA